MADIEGIETYRVGKYQFELKEDYEIALQEKKGVEYLNSQIDYSDVNKVLSTYNELVSKKIFYTPIGLDYLNRLLSVVVNSGKFEPNKIMPLYVPSGKKKDNNRVEKYITRKYKDQMGELNSTVKKLKSANTFLGMLTAVLIIIIIAMFVITVRSDNPNMLNYERALQDKYATWAEDLEEKEQELREWERELEEREQQSK